MSKLNLGVHILAIYGIIIAHQIHGGGLHPTNQKVNMLIRRYTYVNNVFSKMN
jgi:hypothetical protein